MYYPWLDVPLLTAPMLVAIVALLHVFVSHYAVGGGILLAWQNFRALHDGDDEYRGYWKKHAKFFIALTVTYGAVTGVGIWIVIGLASPLTTETLIRTFVFAWAIEWCFFLLEIVSGFAFYYFWDKFNPRSSNFTATTYAFSAWISLVLITAITSFMLNTTGLIPGEDWEATGNFWHAVLNVQFLPQAVARTGCALTLGSFYVLLHASFCEKNLDIREKVTRRMRAPAFIGIALLSAGVAAWAFFLPESSRATLERAAATNVLSGLFLVIIVGIVALLFVGPVAKPRETSTGLAVALFFMGIVGVGVAEFVREAVRKPYVIDRIIFSNQIARADVKRMRQDGLLYTGVWTNWLLDDLQRQEDERVAAAKEEDPSSTLVSHNISGERFFNGVPKYREENVFAEVFLDCRPDYQSDSLTIEKGNKERLEYRSLRSQAEDFLKANAGLNDLATASKLFFQQYERPLTHVEKIDLPQREIEEEEEVEENNGENEETPANEQSEAAETLNSESASIDHVNFVNKTVAAVQYPQNGSASFTPTATNNPGNNRPAYNPNSPQRTTTPPANVGQIQNGTSGSASGNYGASAPQGGMTQGLSAPPAPSQETNSVGASATGGRTPQGMTPTQDVQSSANASGTPIPQAVRQPQEPVSSREPLEQASDVDELDDDGDSLEQSDEGEVPADEAPEPDQSIEDRDLELYGPIAVGNTELLELADGDRAILGRAIFNYHCNCCHAGEHGYSAVGPMIAGRSQSELTEFAMRLNYSHYYMPPWAGTKVEAQLLAEYLVSISTRYPKNVFAKPMEKKVKKASSKKKTSKTDKSGEEAEEQEASEPLTNESELDSSTEADESK